MLRVESAHGAEHAWSEEAERKTQHEHCLITERDLCVRQHHSAGADGEYQECQAASDDVGEISAGQVAAKGPDDEHGQIACGIENRQAAFGAEKGRQPCRDCVVAALRARSHQRAQECNS